MLSFAQREAWPLRTAFVSVSALAVIGLSGNWRIAALACVAGAAIIATRIRFTSHVAALLLVAVAVLALDHRAGG